MPPNLELEHETTPEQTRKVVHVAPLRELGSLGAMVADLVPLVLLGYSDNPGNPTRFKNNSRRRFRRTFYLRLVIPDARNICAHVFVAYIAYADGNDATSDRSPRPDGGRAGLAGRAAWLAGLYWHCEAVGIEPA